MKWHFIEYAEYDAGTNMALDEVLLEEHLENKIPPTLRLYGFHPPAVSLGHSQKISPAICRNIARQGFDLVRRPTGGRAVLHFKDLTYSFTGSQTGTSEAGFLQTSVHGAYKQICYGLQCAFKILGLETALGANQTAYRHLADCFLATTGADLHVKGKKLAGSAQLRRHQAVLQHGSIPLYQEQDLMTRLFSLDEETDAKITIRHANLFDLLNYKPSYGELNEAFRAGFETAFSSQFEIRSFTKSELAQAKQKRLCYILKNKEPFSLLS